MSRILMIIAMNVFVCAASAQPVQNLRTPQQVTPQQKAQQEAERNSMKPIEEAPSYPVPETSIRATPPPTPPPEPSPILAPSPIFSPTPAPAGSPAPSPIPLASPAASPLAGATPSMQNFKTGGQEPGTVVEAGPVVNAPPPTSEFSPLLESVYVDNLFAELVTTAGTIKMKLFGRESPKNVENFIGLASGTKVFTDLNGSRERRPFYTGLTFFRVHPKYAVYSGCPTSNGRGGPGFSVKDEPSRLKFDKPYMVAMSNYGKDTNGSQFFITLKAAPELTGKYTIIGQVIAGYKVVKHIVNLPVDALARPRTAVSIQEVRILQDTKVLNAKVD